MVALVAITAPVGAGGVTAQHKPTPELRICVDPDNPPLSLNRVGAQPGIDVEIGQAIAERIGLHARLVWVDTTYGGRALRRSLLAGQCELFMGLPMDPAAETEGALALTVPYYSTGYRLIEAQHRPRPASATAAIQDARIGVERQSGAHMRLEQIGSRLVVYANQREVLRAVARGEVDVGAVWIPDVDRLLQGEALTVRAAQRAAPDKPLRWNVAIGVRRTEGDLRAGVNRAIGELLAEGRIKAIFDRYAVPFFDPFVDR
jgi:ABC-type amino acid transport substrate-binding protein